VDRFAYEKAERSKGMGRAMRVRGIAGLVLIGALTACSSGLKADDPNGYEACRLLDEAKGTKGIDGFGLYLGVGESAAKAKDDGIRAASGALLDDEGKQAAGRQIYAPDREKMTDACAAAGYEFKN
jgi:hypothetical protein